MSIISSAPLPTVAVLHSATVTDSRVDLLLAWNGDELVLRNVGRKAARDLTLDVPFGHSLSIARLKRRAQQVVAEPGQHAVLADVGVVFVDWTHPDGSRRATALRVPPVPARLSVGLAA
ncbi:hypothetical protein [Desertivibrio insolitus]|uniref:hypothetical protein n=1 Tax=Herbiconiux sp. SYSU D00978 TaxID=2812562 RepID=UPI001A959BFA|nr:hypothetical protein [Herbiconiux sp. SYSU D00978]